LNTLHGPILRIRAAKSSAGLGRGWDSKTVCRHGYSSAIFFAFEPGVSDTQFELQLNNMAATLEKICPVCDKRHSFVLADLSATTAENREYLFTCPELEKVGFITFDRPADIWNSVPESPNDCVMAY